MPVIEASGLTKRFRIADKQPGLRGSLRHLVRPRHVEHVAVDGVDLSISSGEAVAYVGPNGAGKSTTVKLLTGILHPTAGRVRVCGLDPHRDRHANARNIGVLFGQRSQLWWDLQVRDSLALLRDIHRIPRARYAARLDEFDALLGLGRLLPVVARQLSLGQRMRADLAAALLHSPPVVFLDEPTIGLDIVARQAVRDFLRAQRAGGTTVLMTTHDIGDIEQVCRRLVIIDGGRIIFDGSIDAVRRLVADQRTVHLTLGADWHGDLDADLPGVRLVHDGSARQIAVTFDHGAYGAGEIVSVVARQAPVVDIRIDEPSIEDVVRRAYAGELSPSVPA
ncbi:ATP-binding cassette domain-containing protein [Micromonospora sp. CMU55-4]|uniref:ABC transporter ATP-binding protein n=1 Tax=Micromonospora sp. CMU55-4 TaxID=2717028 RepID=UPI00140A9E99|nr:ATP-binding cassette domain-containing protein [Micromonospora sp. CMU55-4]NHO81091.1 ATP-binding cassette domain-containing protein [Micromonospora sp. CMU55-4]